MNDSAYPSEAVDDVSEISSDARTVSALVALRARQQAAKVAYRFLVDGEKEVGSLTYQEVLEGAERVAHLLRSRQTSGKPILLLYPAGLEFIVAFFGVLLSGNIAVPVAVPRASGALHPFAGIARNSGAPLLLTVGELVEQARELSKGIANGLECIATDALPPGERATESAAEPSSVALLQYTSGSTSAPKGTIVTHRNIMHNQAMIRRAFGHSSETTFVTWLPHHHDMGLIGTLLQPFYVGGSCVLMPPEAFIRKPSRWLRAMSRYRGTTAGAPNFAFEMCADDADALPDVELESWSVAFVGAEPVRRQTLERFAARFERNGFRRTALFPCYGMAEATLFVSGGPRGTGPWSPTKPAGSPDDIDLVSSGVATWSTEVKIVEPESGRSTPAGAVGEIWLRGDAVTSGYWNDDAATAAAFGTLGGKSYFRTGDLGYLDGDQVIVSGRLKDVIIVAGRKYHAEDVELLAMTGASREAFRAATAFGTSGANATEERIVLACELRSRAPASHDLDAVVAELRSRIWTALGITVSLVVLVPAGALPRTTSGKIRRAETKRLLADGGLRELRRWELPHRGGGSAAGRDPRMESLAEAEEWFASAIATRLGIQRREVGVHAPFAALGLESRDLMTLGAALSDKLGCELEPALFWRYPSLVELFGFLRTSGMGTSATLVDP